MASRTMNAAIYHRFGGPIVVERIPIPTCPMNGVVLQVMATGVCRSDWHGWKGHDDDISSLPFCPGHEFSGRVLEVGAECDLMVGDRVAVPFVLSCGACQYCRQNQPTVCTKQLQPGFSLPGSFAEYVAVPRATRNVVILPDTVSFVQAAALGCRMSTAYRAVVHHGRVSPANVVAIFGCGGVGLSCVMLCKAAGATTIIAVDVNEAALRKARDLGATHTVNASHKTAKAIHAEVRALTVDQDGADVTIEAAGFASTCDGAVYCTRPAGRMIQVGLPIGSELPQIPMGRVAAKELQILGSHGFGVSELRQLLELVATRQIDPQVLVERHVTLAQGAQAIQDMDHGSPLGITMVTDFGNATTSAAIPTTQSRL